MSTQFWLDLPTRGIFFKTLLNRFQSHSVTLRDAFLTLCSWLRARARLCICRCSAPISILWVNLVHFFCTLPTHCPSLGLIYSATAEFRCRATAPAVTAVPPTEGMRASVGTYTLGQGVGENSFLFFFFSQENFGVQFLPAGSTPQWRGEGSQHYMCCRSVYSAACILFWGRSGIIILMYARVHTCACVCCIVCMQVRLP